MRLKLLLIMLFASCANLCFAGENQSEQIWQSAHTGNFSLTHKLMLTRQDKTLDDAMLSEFIMAYVYHCMGRDEDTMRIIKDVEVYLDYRFSKDTD